MTQPEALASILRALSEAKFYGEVLIKFENGHVVVVKKTESIKLSEERG